MWRRSSRCRESTRSFGPRSRRRRAPSSGSCSPPGSRPEEQRMETFDYVVVGGGTAGCIVATRLSEDTSVSVLLLEAGGNERRPDIETPERWLELMGSDVDWAYETVVQVATGRPVPTPRGKALGGSGSTNGMTYLRAPRLDHRGCAA